jgi:hypothetical protein
LPAGRVACVRKPRPPSFTRCRFPCDAASDSEVIPRDHGRFSVSSVPVVTELGQMRGPSAPPPSAAAWARLEQILRFSDQVCTSRGRTRRPLGIGG